MKLSSTHVQDINYLYECKLRFSFVREQLALILLVFHSKCTGYIENYSKRKKQMNIFTSFTYFSSKLIPSDEIPGKKVKAEIILLKQLSSTEMQNVSKEQSHWASESLWIMYFLLLLVISTYFVAKCRNKFQAYLPERQLFARYMQFDVIDLCIHQKPIVFSESSTQNWILPEPLYYQLKT